MTDTTKVEIGDVLNTAYGRMGVVDIEMEYNGEGWLETRAVDEDGELIKP